MRYCFGLIVIFTIPILFYKMFFNEMSVVTYIVTVISILLAIVIVGFLLNIRDSALEKALIQMSYADAHNVDRQYECIFDASRLTLVALKAHNLSCSDLKKTASVVEGVVKGVQSNQHLGLQVSLYSAGAMYVFDAPGDCSKIVKGAFIRITYLAGNTPIKIEYENLY